MNENNLTSLVRRKRMKNLTKRTLRILSVLEHYRAGSDDVLDALLPFFEPLLEEGNGTPLDPISFAAQVRAAYGWNFTADIVEELIPRFVSKGLLRQVGSNSAPSYIITFSAPAALTSSNISIDDVVSEVSDEFADFIGRISPLSAVNKSKQELVDILIEWLVSIDAYTEDTLRQKTREVVAIGETLTLEPLIGDGSTLHQDDRYLCARFVKELFAHKSPLSAHLCKIASIGLLTEVIQDFHKPATQITRTNLVVYLDGPVALDLLGVSGKEAAANIRPIISKLQDIGAQCRIFRVSVDELTRALEAVLRRPKAERTGATADALRRNETDEAFIRQVILTPDEMLKAYSVTVSNRSISAFPGEHEYFTDDMKERFYGRLNWHSENHPREHDTQAITMIMRMRKGVNTNDIFQSKAVFITRNGKLAAVAKDFAVSTGVLLQKSVGPAIHQRQIATAMWLRTGLSQEEDGIPKRFLLSACERVLELRKTVVDQVRHTARNLTKEKAEQLDLMLTQDRSVQVLMDKTLGVSSVITGNNIEELVDEMKQSLVEELEQQQKLKVRDLKAAQAKALKELEDRRTELLNDKNALELALNERDDRDRASMIAFLNAFNKKNKLMIVIIRLILALAALVPLALAIVVELTTGSTRWAAIISGAALSSVLLALQIFERPFNIAKKIEAYSRRRLLAAARNAGAESNLDRYFIVYRNGNFQLAAKPSLGEPML